MGADAICTSGLLKAVAALQCSTLIGSTLHNEDKPAREQNHEPSLEDHLRTLRRGPTMLEMK